MDESEIPQPGDGVVMDPLRHLTAERGFFTRKEALSAGYDDRLIARLVRSSTWIRFRRGYYAFPDEWRCLDEVGRHEVRSNAVLHSLGDTVALSHQSGVVKHGLEVWGLDLRRVHVTRLDDGAGRIEGDVVHHEGRAADTDLVDVGDSQVLRAERCVLEAASRTSNEVALALFDSGLRMKAYDDDALCRQFGAMERWPFMRHLHIPVRMADARSGSIGESRGFWWFRQLGIPVPIPQFEIRDASGRLIGIVDWWWELLGLMGEFDGKVKYGRLLKPGQDPGDAVFDEKVREDALREATGCKMIRLTWSDYDRPRDILARFERLVGRAS